MSTTVDQRVVEMRFDNKNFESNVSTTMETLDKFNQKLKLPGASKGLEEINSTAKGMDFSTLTNAVETIGKRFSTLGIMATTALVNITNSAVNAGKKIVSALTIDPIKSGFQEYETQINAVQTILANTESKGTTLQDVNRALDELNTYADKTIYNFTEMTRNIGTFTAAGVDLDTAVSAIQGIANLAAVSGSTSQQASTAMYQLSQALSSGTVKLMDWNSVVNAGMGGQVFQDALKQTARVHGIAIDKMIEKEGSFRETLSKGWLTSDILTETLNQFTMAAEEGSDAWEAYKKSLMDTGYSEDQAISILKMANTATDAATKVKTFTQLWDTLKEAAQSGWTQSWEIMIGDFEEAKDFLTDISNRMGEIIGNLADSRNAVLSGGLSTGWKQLLNAGIADEEGYKEKIKSVVNEHGIAIDDMIKSEKELDETLSDREAFQKVLIKGLKDKTITSDMLSESVHKMAAEMSSMSTEELKASGYTVEYVEQIKALSSGLKDGSISMDDFVKKMTRPSGRENIIQALWNSFDALMDIMKPVNEAFREIFPPITGEQLYELTVKIRDLTEKFKLSESTANDIKRTFKGVFAVLDIGVKLFKAIGKGIIDLIKNFSGLGGTILENAASLGDFLVKLRDTITNTDIFNKSIGKVVEVISLVINKIKELGSKITNSEIFNKTIERAVELISLVINKIKELGSRVSNAFDIKKGGILDFFVALYKIMVKVGTTAIKVAKSINKAISEIVGKGDIFEVVNSGLIISILIGVKTLVNSLKRGSDSIGGFLKNIKAIFNSLGGIFKNVKGILDDVRGCLQAYQDQLKAGTLLKIASAIGILAAALFVLSTIDPDKLASALVAITGLFVELIGSLSILQKMPNELTGIAKTISLMIGMSVSILLLAFALKKISSADFVGVIKGLIGMAGSMGILIAAIKLLNTGDKAITKFAGQMILMSIAIGILSVALKSISSMSWTELAKGGSGLLGITILLVTAAKIMDTNDRTITKFAGQMILMSIALGLLTPVLKSLGNMGWEEIAKGLVAIGGALAIIVIGLNFMKGTISGSAALVIAAAALAILIPVMKKLGGLSWEEIARGLVAIGGALALLAIGLNLMTGAIVGSAALVIATTALLMLIPVMQKLGGLSWEEIGKGLATLAGALALLAIGLNLMTGAIAGSAALIVAAVALSILAPVMKTLGGLSWEAIGKGLITIAGAFAVIGIAGLLLAQVIPSILSLAAAFALFSVSIALMGAGLVLMAVGFTAFSGAIVASASGIVAGLTIIVVGICDLIPILLQAVFELIVGVCKVVGDGAPLIVGSVLKLVSEVIKSLATYAPKIVGSLVDLLVGLIYMIADHLPQLIEAVMYLISSLIQGVIAALNGLNTENLINGIVAIGLMAALIYALSGVASLIGPAMIAIIGIGLVIAELALVLAAIGKLSQIPGLQSLIEDGGGLLEKIGTALGQFIGGLAGGIAKGFSSSLPEIGTDLSAFMKNAQYFIEGAKNIDTSVLTGISILSGAIIALTAAEFINGIASFLIGGGSLSDFSNQLVPFGKSMKEYSDAIVGLDTETVTASANAAKALAEFACNLPNSGGLVSLFSGDNSLSDFATQLIPFGESMKAYSDAIAGINPEAVTASANAAMALAELATNLPNSGGLVSLFSGDNSLSDFATQLTPFGTAMKEYSDSVVGINPESVIASANAAKTLSELAANLPNSGGLVSLFTGDNSLLVFAAQIVPFGKAMKSYAESISGINPEAVTSSANAAMSLSELASNLPNSGGLVSLFTGENSLSTFAYQLVVFGKGMKSYAESISGIDPEAVTASANAAKLLVELANNIPNSGGLVSLFTGDNSIASFGLQLVPFGKGMKAYADSVAGIDPEAVTASANAAKSLSELATNLPNSGGLVSLFTGDNSLISFAYQLAPLGRGMKAYADSVSGINPESVIASANAAKTLSELAANLPNSGGFISLFTGENSLITFAYQLAPLGRGMKAYADSIAGIDTEAVISSANAAKSLSELATNLPNSGGLISLLTGDNSLASFAYQLAPLGKGMKAYADSVIGIDANAVSASATAAKSLSELANNLPNSGGLVGLISGENSLASFGTDLVPFGKGMKAYADSVTGIDANAVTASANAAKTLSELAANLPNSGGFISLFTGENSLASFGWDLVPFGKGMKAYADSVIGIDANAVSASATAAKSLSELANNLPNSGGFVSLFTGDNSLSDFTTNLVPFGEGIKAYADSVTGIDAGAIISSSTAAKSLVNLVNSTAGIDSSGVSSFVNAINNLGNMQLNKFVEAFDNSSEKMAIAGTKMMNSLVASIQSKTGMMILAASSIISKFVYGLTNQIPRINNFSSTMINNLLRSISSKSSAFTSVGSMLMTKFIVGISSQKERVINATKEPMTLALSEILGYYGEFHSAGSYVVDGFAAGISANTFKAEATAIAMAEAALEAAKKALLEHSPSRAFYKVGDYAGQGFVNALSDYESISYNSSYDMADYARKGLSDAIGKINDAFHNDIDPQPTIRPILDLTNVESGASYISGLFSNGASIGVTTRVGSINSMMNRNNQNGANREVVSAIEGLRKDLGKVGGTTYNVNGITYDDGSTVSRAIQDIVRAANIERRA